VQQRDVADELVQDPGGPAAVRNARSSLVLAAADDLGADLAVVGELLDLKTEAAVPQA
jgi:hypothetical protein